MDTIVFTDMAIHNSWERIASRLCWDQCSTTFYYSTRRLLDMISLFYPWDTIPHSDYHGSNALKNYTGQELLRYLS